MMSRWFMLLVVSVLLVTGCATSRAAYTKPGVSDEQRTRDQTECVQSAIGDAGRGGGHLLVPVMIDRDVFQSCLESRGYSRVAQ